MRVKVNTYYGDCLMEDEITCPFCGAVQGDSWEYGDGEDIGEVECGYCSREFYAHRDITIAYTSRPIDLEPWADWERGDVFDDGITDQKDEDWANINGVLPCEVVGKLTEDKNADSEKA